MSIQAKIDNPDQAEVYAALMVHSRGQDNDHILACILSSWQTGEGALPNWLGLSQEEYLELMAFHFSGFNHANLTNPGFDPDTDRLDESGELHQLLTTHCDDKSPSAQWMAKIVVNACQGQDHLWQDLGLWSRKDLSQLMLQNFPGLAVRNDKDMKWKKFLYKQLCIAEGIYTCRAPSCEVCVDYAQCFGSEE